jgi:hypothetical protein
MIKYIEITIVRIKEIPIALKIPIAPKLIKGNRKINLEPIRKVCNN